MHVPEPERHTEQARSFTRWWVRGYTRGLAAEVRDRRRAELDCDVHDQLHAMAGRDHSRVAVTWRTMRGIPADLSWRRQEKRAMRAATPDPNGFRLRNTWAVVTQNWFAPLAVLIGLFNVLTSVAVLTEADGTMPGKVIGPIVMSALALSVFGGLWLRWRAGTARAAGPRPPRPAASGRQLGVLVAILVAVLALLVVGASTGTVPVFFTALVLLAGTAMVVAGRVVRRALGSSDVADRQTLADGMIIVGTLPALALFWMVIPPVLAIAVIAGVLGTNPRVRPAV